jgi:hypothetical protein
MMGKAKEDIQMKELVGDRFVIMTVGHIGGYGVVVVLVVLVVW